jgi:hypothetical protein
MVPERNPAIVALSRQTIVDALQGVSDRLGGRGVDAEICLFGGAVMVLAFSARSSTRDVDAIFQPAQLVRDIAEEIARAQGIPSGWLNDGVKGFVSTSLVVTQGNLPQFPHLRLTMPVPEYLLAMKCMAARIGVTSADRSDVSDIVFLLKHLGIESASDALDVVAKYYPAERISIKTQFLLEGLFEEGAL